MSQFPIPGPERRSPERERRQRGVNLTGTWDFLSGITPMLNSMFSRWDRMAQIAERSAARRPSMEMHAFRQQQKRWDEENKLSREMRQERQRQRQRQMRDDFQAKQNRQMALSRLYGIKTDDQGRVIPRNVDTVYGGESPHQSEAQLAGWGVEGEDVLTPTASQRAGLSGLAGGGGGGAGGPYAPVGGGGGGGGLIGDINVTGGTVAPGPAYGAMMGGSGGGGFSYIPFQTSFQTDFESADIDTKRKKDEY